VVKEKKTVRKTNPPKKQESFVDDSLSGMKSICSYVHRSEPTVLALVRSSGFPAKKLGGIWESRKSLIDEWRAAYLSDEGMAS
jgi:hypothetical protein